MMATTHILAGVALAAVVAVFAPELAVIAAIAAIVGGVVPDLDVVASHRRTLHFPVYYSIGAVLAGGLALATPTPATVAIAIFLLAAACHSVADAAGGGLELRPWKPSSDRGVYDHYRGIWVRPRRWIRYDGAPEDLLLAVVLAIPGLLVFNGRIETLLVVLLVISICYTALRKPIVRVSEWLAQWDRSPPWLRSQLAESPTETDGGSRQNQR